MFSPCANYQLSGKATADGPSETEKTGTPCTLHVNRLSAGVTVSACSKAIYYFDSPAETTPSASLSLPSGLHVSHAVFLNGFFFALSEKTSVKRKRKAKSVLECWNAADSSVIFSQELLKPAAGLDTLGSSHIVCVNNDTSISVFSCSAKEGPVNSPILELDNNDDSEEPSGRRLLYSRTGHSGKRILLCFSDPSLPQSIYTQIISIANDDEKEIQVEASEPRQIQLLSASPIQRINISKDCARIVPLGNKHSHQQHTSIPCPSVSSLCLLDGPSSEAEYVAIFRSEESSNTPLSCVWDTKFGARHHQYRLMDDSTDASDESTFAVESDSLLWDDEFYLAAVSTLILPDGSFSFSYSSRCYNLPKVNLRTALGKMSLAEKTQMATVDEPWSTLMQTTDRKALQSAWNEAGKPKIPYAMVPALLTHLTLPTLFSQVVLRDILSSGHVSFGQCPQLLDRVLDLPQIRKDTLKALLTDIPDASAKHMAAVLVHVCEKADADPAKAPLRDEIVEFVMGLSFANREMVDALVPVQMKHILELVAWVERVLGPSVKPLDEWFLSPKAQAVFDKAVLLLSLILDAHLHAFNLAAPDSNLHQRLTALGKIVCEYKNVSALIDGALRAPMHHAAQRLKQRKALKLAAAKQSKKLASKSAAPPAAEKKYQQRWQRMVGDVTDGVGVYAIEMLKLDTNSVLVE